MTDRVDNFDGGSGTLNGRTPSGGGSAWTVGSGAFSLFDNRAQYDSGSPGVAWLESDVANVAVSAPMQGPGGSTVAGLVARYTDANNYLFACWFAFEPAWRIYRREAGTNVQIGASLGGSAYSAFDTVTFEVQGTALRVKVNGVQVGTDRTSTFNQTATKHGLWSDTIMTWSEVSITEVSGPPPAPVLSGPGGTVTSNTAATITHTTDTPGTGNTYSLRRTGGSPASAATIIATGVSAATGGTGSQSRSVTALGGTANQFWDIAQDGPSNVITVGPLSTATTLSSPTGAATGTTTATAGFTTDRAVSAGFPAYFLTLPSATAAPADAAALIANGATVSQTTGGTTPTRGITGLSAATVYRTHMAQPGSNVVSSAPYTTDAAGTAPTITVQPSNQTVTAGAAATFSVTATGSGLTYQWRRNGTPISGATSASYTTPATTVSGGTANNGDVYSVVVTGDTAPAATSSNATLTVNAAAPGIFSALTDVIAESGIPLANTLVYFTWCPAGRPGAISGPVNSTATTDATGRATISHSVAGLGMVLIGTRPGPTMVNDRVFAQFLTLA